MTFIPSCDNREDAIRSLSEIYTVSTEKIDRALQAQVVQEIAEEYSEIKTDGFHFVVCSLLGASPRTDITHASFYHSTSYNGSTSWFDDGLLGSSQGAGRFLDKIIEWLPLTSIWQQRRLFWRLLSVVASTKDPQPRRAAPTRGTPSPLPALAKMESATGCRRLFKTFVRAACWLVVSRLT